jgi:hypothetical protein
MVAPLILPPSDSETALYNAIRMASEQGAELLLMPGVHLTPSDKLDPIPIGANGLTVRSHDPQHPAVIKRPDQSIVLAKPDDHHGLFFIPARATDAEIATMQWHQGTDPEKPHGPITFGVVIRGEVRFESVIVDCNMGNQLLETLDMTIKENKAEHSCMLGFRGDHKTPEGAAGRVYTGFSLVSLTNVETLNGEYADDIWISRGGFYPNIREMRFDRITSNNPGRKKRSTICFSGLARRVSITNSNFYELGVEDATATDYNELPRATPWFIRAQFLLNNLTLKRLDLGARGQVYELLASDIDVTESTHLYQAAGTISSSQLHIGPNTEPKLERCPGLAFRDVDWTLDAQANTNGLLRGIRPHSRNGEECRLRFVRNKFHVPAATHGHIIFSEASKDDRNRVHVWFLDCEFPKTWGKDDQRLIADIQERGLWFFSTSSLDGRDEDIACPVKQTDDNGVFRIIFPWPSFF